MLVKTNLIPAGFDAVSAWPFIFVRPQMADNRGLIEHETVHYREQRRWLCLPWWIAYLLVPSFRQAAEVRAYRRQIEVGGISVEHAAYFLTQYRTGINESQATALLTA